MCLVARSQAEPWERERRHRIRTTQETSTGQGASHICVAARTRSQAEPWERLSGYTNKAHDPDPLRCAGARLQK
ncbi:MAG: hypothetical protein GDA43_23515 [Hormoscilla sp. SP5CHS1]|nr:hypothetical protein [Hormoscilla sp. SP5CHS1]